MTETANRANHALIQRLETVTLKPESQVRQDGSAHAKSIVGASSGGGNMPSSTIFGIWGLQGFHRCASAVAQVDEPRWDTRRDQVLES